MPRTKTETVTTNRVGRGVACTADVPAVPTPRNVSRSMYRLGVFFSRTFPRQLSHSPVRVVSWWTPNPTSVVYTLWSFSPRTLKTLGLSLVDIDRVIDENSGLPLFPGPPRDLGFRDLDVPLQKTPSKTVGVCSPPGSRLDWYRNPRPHVRIPNRLFLALYEYLIVNSWFCTDT